MTYTIWSQGGKHEWIIQQKDEIFARSGLQFNSRSAAQTNLNKFVREMK